MSDAEFQFENHAGAAEEGSGQPSGKPAEARARQLTVSVLLGSLAGEGDSPREGERDIVASAIRRALETSSPSEFPSLARLIAAEGRDELDQRAARCRHSDMSMWGNYQDAPVLASCAEIHRNGFVDADGKEARCKLFMALVDLAISCTELLASKPFKVAAAGPRLLLGRLSALPKGGSATHHFSVWQIFDWVEQHPDFAEYVKNAIRTLRPGFILAWRAFDSKDDDVADNDQAENARHEETTPNEAFWLLPESARYECDLPEILKEKLLSIELTRITALSRYASASLLVRADSEMQSVVSSLLDVAKDKPAEAPHALAQLLSIATGITVDHAYKVKYSDPADFASAPAYPGIVTPDGAWLVRSEFDPRSKPKERFEPRTVHLPIPEPIAALLRGQPKGIRPGEHAIHMPVGVTKQKIPRAESEWFTTLASCLMRDRRYGVSLAQHALHTSLGLDTAPLYYDRIPAAYLAHAMARITHPWFDCPPRPRASAMPSHCIGSQRIADKARCKSFFRSLRVEWSNGLPLFRRIHLRSRNFRHGLFLAIAFRTNTSIAQISRTSIASKHLIMTVSDKAVALDHVSRLVALSPKLVRELEEYLAELHQATHEYPNTALAASAAGILQGEQSLFLHVDSVDDCHAVDLEHHLADLPSWAASIPNWVRRLANACLCERLPEPLRVAQMGWHGTRAGAVSELSTQPPDVVQQEHEVGTHGTCEAGGGLGAFTGLALGHPGKQAATCGTDRFKCLYSAWGDSNEDYARIGIYMIEGCVEDVESPISGHAQ
jgi:hypothetical protein